MHGSLSATSIRGVDEQLQATIPQCNNVENPMFVGLDLNNSKTTNQNENHHFKDDNLPSDGELELDEEDLKDGMEDLENEDLGNDSEDQCSDFGDDY